jgi:hypothetical protein
MSKTVTSLEGIAHYPHLNKPDTRFDADGTYHLKLRMDSENPKVAKFLEWIDAEHEASKKEFAAKLLEDGKVKTQAAADKKTKDGDKPYVYEEDDDGEETNMVLVNFKMKAHVKTKAGKEFDLEPKFFDAAGKPIKGRAKPLVYGGSKLKVAFTPIHWGSPKLGCSIRLRLEAIQILELVTGGGSDNAEDYGFGAEEGGYVAPAADAMPAAAEYDDADDGDDDDDGTGDF